MNVTIPTSTTSVADHDIRRLAEAVPHFIWIADADGGLEFLNQYGLNYFGVDFRSLQGQGWQTMLHPDDTDRVVRAWAVAIADASTYELIYRLGRFDGEYRWQRVLGVPLLDGDGLVAKWIGTVTDVDEQKQAETRRELAEHETAETLTLLESLQLHAPMGIAFVDTEFRIIRVNKALAEAAGGTIEVQLGRTVAEVSGEFWDAMAVNLQEVRDSGEAQANLRLSGPSPDGSNREVHWLVSFYPVRLQGAITGIGIVAVDITDQIEAERQRQQITEAAVDAIAATVDARDPYTAGHQRRVSIISAAIAHDLGLDLDAIHGIRLAASIHDIGKIAIPAEILSCPRALSPAEYELVKTHAQIGHDIVAGIEFPWPIARMILQHHERQDGSGYPNSLKGDEIEIGARIIAVADTVEAMASHRPYRPALGIDTALAEIKKYRGVRYDEDVAEACLRLFRTGQLSLDHLG